MNPLSYKSAGVDVEAGDTASRRAFLAARSTYRPEISEQAGVVLFDGRFHGYQEPMLLGGSDGVGTKLKIAFTLNKHDTVGIDLVAMCVNDIVRRGGEPLVFLPYFATGKLSPDTAEQVALGIAEGCRQANCSIIGGETAEMPDFYQVGEYDLAGSCFGVVEKSKLITGQAIQAGDVILGLASSGIHSNGYSLARKALTKYTYDQVLPGFEGKTLGEILLTPTRIYVKAILAAVQANAPLHGLAHITGGGFRKLYKIVPQGLEAKIDFASWDSPPVFNLIQLAGNVPQEEMYQTFNMGIGFVAIVPPDSASAVQSLFEQNGEKVYQIGEVIRL
jgi:phosphoribosylformylglycinamidine cyclo-ligase